MFYYFNFMSTYRLLVYQLFMNLLHALFLWLSYQFLQSPFTPKLIQNLLLRKDLPSIPLSHLLGRLLGKIRRYRDKNEFRLSYKLLLRQTTERTVKGPGDNLNFDKRHFNNVSINIQTPTHSLSLSLLRLRLQLTN